MARIFTVILNMSITASFAIGLVLLVRLFLKRCPKIYSYILWSVVLVRLLCPFALALPFIEAPFFSDATEPTGTNTSTMTYFSVDDERRQYEQPEHSAPTNELPGGEHGAGADYSSGAVQSDDNNQPTAQAQPDAPVLPEPVPTRPQSRSAGETVFTVLGCIWAAGAAFFIGITAWQNISLRRRLAEAFILRDNIYESAYIDTAFVLGVIRPRIYLPKGLPDEVQQAIVTHEQTHQRRGDHIVKFVSYFALSVHWFNPLAWLSFKLMTADMESSCDEAVIRSLQKRGLAENRVKYAYSKMLVALGSGRLSILSPVSFAEGSIRARVENIAKSRRIRKAAAAAVGCVLVVALVIGIVNPFSVKAEGGEGDVGRSVVSGADNYADASDLTPEHEIFGVPHAPDAKLVKVNGGYYWSDTKELNLAEAFDHPDGRDYTEIDIAQLSEFTSLEALSIRGLTVKNFSLLKGFANLSKLTLEGTKASDLSALGELTQLKSLTLGWDAVEDGWPNAVAKLDNLEYLDASGTFADLHPLSRLPSLKTLIANVETQEELDAVLSIKTLEALSVEEYGLNDMRWSALGELGSLRSLTHNCEAIDKLINLMPYLDNVKELDVCILEESDPYIIKRLSELTQLEKLSLATNFRSFDVLKPLVNIKDLSLCCYSFYGLNTVDLSFVKDHPNLEKLNVQCCSITGCESLTSLKNLIELELDVLYGLTPGEGAEDVDPTFPLNGECFPKTLKTLKLSSGVYLENLSFPGLDSLEALELRGEISGLSFDGLSKLKRLIVYPVYSEYQSFSGLTDLEYLEFFMQSLNEDEETGKAICPIDFRTLSELKNARSIELSILSGSVSYRNLIDLACLSGLSRLRSLDIEVSGGLGCDITNLSDLPELKTLSIMADVLIGEEDAIERFGGIDRCHLLCYMSSEDTAQYELFGDN